MVAEVKSLLNRMAHTPFTCILICPEIGLAIETNIRHGMDYAPDDDQLLLKRPQCKAVAFYHKKVDFSNSV